MVAELWFSSRIKESYPSRMDGFGGNRGTLVGYATTMVATLTSVTETMTVKMMTMIIA